MPMVSHGEKYMRHGYLINEEIMKIFKRIDILEKRNLEYGIRLDT